jgi:hypothetical protein
LGETRKESYDEEKQKNLAENYSLSLSLSLHILDGEAPILKAKQKVKDDDKSAADHPAKVPKVLAQQLDEFS